MNAPSTVDVRCPRCDVPITCTLDLKPVEHLIESAEYDDAYTAFVPDLAEKFAAHYRDAGHVTVIRSGSGGALISGAGGHGGEVTIAPTPNVADKINRAMSEAGRAVGAELADRFGFVPFEGTSRRVVDDVLTGIAGPDGGARLAAAQERVNRAVDRAADAVGRVNVEQAKLDDIRAAGR